MYQRDIYEQWSASQGEIHSTAGIASWASGISADYRSFDPASSQFSTVAPTRASVVNPQRSFASLQGTGRYGSYRHGYANAPAVVGPNSTRISYLTPSDSKPKVYYWAQPFTYGDPTKAEFNNQEIFGLNFYRLSDGSKVVMDQFINQNQHWLYYNQTDRDSNLLTLSNLGAVSKIEATTRYQDNSTNSTTPLIWQTHGGIPADATSTWRTDYSRDSHMQANDRDTYIIYRPSFGSNKQLPVDIETMGEWESNWDGTRSGS